MRGIIAAVTWKHERPEILPNREMAEERLRTVTQTYQSVVEDNLSKEYIREIPEDDRNHTQNGSFHIFLW